VTVLPIASGKGGVGKSLLAANLGIVLAARGKRVVLADLDFGGSNLHLILGVPSARAGIGRFLTDSETEFTDAIVPTDYNNLLFVPGDGEIPGIANLPSGQKRKLINRLGKLDADIVILDLGAGTSFNVMDFFLLSRRGIVITTPTPTALVNGYLCLKNAVFRLLTTSIKRGTEADRALKAISSDTESMQRLYIPELVRRLEAVAPQPVAEFREKLARFRPRIVLNMLRDPKDADRVTRLRRSCQEYLGIELEHLGVMYRDDLQDIALAARLPIVAYKPESVLSQAIERIGDKIVELDAAEESDEWFDSTASFETATAEAETDFEAKSDYVSELLSTGALSQGDLLETVKSQQLEINKLRKENDLLKSKIVRASEAGYSFR
jgi:flagellar biosynthesis protein FlhG